MNGQHAHAAQQFHMDWIRVSFINHEKKTNYPTPTYARTNLTPPPPLYVKLSTLKDTPPPPPRFPKLNKDWKFQMRDLLRLEMAAASDMVSHP